MAQRHPRVRTAVRRPRIGPVNRGEHGGGSFAAFGRDAGLKTGVPAPALLARPSQGDKVRVV